jgi:hypothetical protein
MIAVGTPCRTRLVPLMRPPTEGALCTCRLWWPTPADCPTVRTYGPGSTTVASGYRLKTLVPACAGLDSG